MTGRADFSAEEWRTITEAVALAGMIMIGLERGGRVRKSLAMAGAYERAQKESEPGDLVGDVARSAPDISDRDFGGRDELRSTGLRRLTEAAALVELRATPDELRRYRELVMAMARAVAEAHRSGGFLGIGGERVDHAESAAVLQIAAAVGADA